MQLNPLACFVYVALLAAAFAVLPASAFQIIWTETDPHFVNSWVAGKTSFAISDDNPTLPETILMPDENEICTRIKRAQKHREIAVYHSGLRLARIAMQEPYGSSYAYVQTNVLYQNDPDIFFCCNECDTPIQTGNFPSETALNLYGYVRPDAIIIACKAGALLQKPVCKCTDLGPSVQSWCPIGSYLGGCTLANPTYTCKPCTNIDTTTAEFISNAGTSNNCLFRCKSGLFYDRSIKTEKCVPCSTCGDGFRVTKACSRDVNFETFASNDVKCSACEIAHKQSPTNSSKCVPCGFGFAANQITNGCFKCGDMQFTSTMTAAECTNCPHGMKPNSARSACNNCGRGHYRNYLTMVRCLSCAFVYVLASDTLLDAKTECLRPMSRRQLPARSGCFGLLHVCGSLCPQHGHERVPAMRKRQGGSPPLRSHRPHHQRIHPDRQHRLRYVRPPRCSV
jgi:hypothetical protein